MSPIPARATLYHYRTDEKTAGPVSKEVIDTLAAARQASVFHHHGQERRFPELGPPFRHSAEAD